MNVPTTDLTQLNNNGNPWPLFDPTTKSFDCNVTKTIEALHDFNGTQLTVKQARAIGGAPGPQATGSDLAEAVFLAHGMVKGTDFKIAYHANHDALKALLYAGEYVTVFINYGALLKAGGVSGDKKYTGAHAIGLWGWRRKGGQVLVWDHDPLFDGRRSAIPYGRQHVPLDPIWTAMQAFAGANQWSGWAVKIPL